MHELSYIMDIINSVKELQEKEGAKNVEKIVLEVGKMSGVVPYYLEKYFNEVKDKASLENTVLEVHEMEVKIKCSSCSKIYIPGKENRYRCPVCGERSGDLIQGKGIIIKEVTIEDGLN